MVFLLCASLFILPLIGSVSVLPIINLHELWQSKEAVSLILIFFLLLYSSPSRDIENNKWVSALLIFLVISCLLIPPVSLRFGPGDLGGLWVWKSMFWVVVYFMLYRKILSLPILHFDQKKFLARAIGYAAFVSSIYAILQWFNLDQFQAVLMRPNHSRPPSAELTAMIGAPFYLSIFLGVCVPFCLYAMRWWQTGIVLIAIFLCNSDTTNIFVPFILYLYYSLRSGKKTPLVLLVVLAVISLFFIASNQQSIKHKISSMASGRVVIWKETVKDWKSPCIILDITEDMTPEKKKEISILNKRTWSLTGRGVGSFEYLFQRKFPGWNDPHNVYLRMLYEAGIIGLFLFLACLAYVLKRTFPITVDPWILTLFCSMVFLCCAGLTTPLFIIEPLRFYSVFVFSMLSCQIPRRENNNDFILK